MTLCNHSVTHRGAYTTRALTAAFLHSVSYRPA